MKASIGWWMQLGGMLVLPIALYLGMARDNVRLEVQLLAIGGALFPAGRLLMRSR
ncbi:MAG: hypothetical protein QOH21_286 [Acidobacteriota bacterium]|nr:hypothetical protein [Acidobacteriota bacterium]